MHHRVIFLIETEVVNRRLFLCQRNSFESQSKAIIHAFFSSSMGFSTLQVRKTSTIDLWPVSVSLCGLNSIKPTEARTPRRRSLNRENKILMNILLVKAPSAYTTAVKSLLSLSKGYAVDHVSGTGPALMQIKEKRYDIIVTDARKEIDGIQLANESRVVQPHLEVIIFAAEVGDELVSKAQENGIGTLIAHHHNHSFITPLLQAVSMVNDRLKETFEPA